ncbi:DUF6456 domain-containing protein [Consotaella salsifontis]|uniref:DUF6456 domain-containing protein n=1 Tax=Consotaella salsifontis TaxID=1365950 RepID=A0A1T4MG70_9HYPH|nr:DUF6456 domain-containing protein [Consotaella salsifontis]SJZ65851.1 hypothetical protein SAMN05428963_102106 [Consotaella salsifontis]
MTALRQTFNQEESPLYRLATRAARDGRPFLAPSEAMAGERLRADFTRAGLTPAVSQRWDFGAKASEGWRGASDLSETALDAKARVNSAIASVGPELSGVLLDVCCFLKGLETVEHERCWPARSAKLLLKAGLGMLARHYGFDREAGSGKSGHIRRWGAADYRPTITGADRDAAGNG